MIHFHTFSFLLRRKEISSVDFYNPFWSSSNVTILCFLLKSFDKELLFFFPFNPFIFLFFYILFLRISICYLGSINSYPSNVFKKPFSSSVLRFFFLVFATTTKICTIVKFRFNSHKNFKTLFVLYMPFPYSLHYL